jgi:hypothetical protein
MLQSNLEIDEQQVSLSLYGYLRHYRFNLQEYLSRGMEDFDSSRIVMPNQTKIRIEEEIARVDLVLSSYSNYKRNTNQNEK